MQCCVLLCMCVNVTTFDSAVCFVLGPQLAMCSSALHLVSPSPVDGADKNVKTFASYLKKSKLRKLELTKCYNLSPVHIATILNGLNGNNSLEELVVTPLYSRVSHVLQCDSCVCTRRDGSDTKLTGQF